MRGLGVLAALAACVACEGSGAAGQASAGADARWLSATWAAPSPLQASQRAEGACPVQQGAVLAARPNGALVALWRDATKGDLAPLVWSERPAEGQPWGEPRPVVPDSSGYWQDGPAQVVRLPDGGLVAAWRTATPASATRKVRLATLRSGEGAWTPAPPPVEGDAQGLVLAAGPDGLHAAWSDGGIRHARLGPDGRWTAAESLRPPGRTVSVEVVGGPSPQHVPTTGAAPVLAVGPNGSVLVAWWDDERTLDRSGAANHDLVARLWDPAQGAWSAPEYLKGTRSEETDAAAAAARDGFILVWTDDRRRLRSLHRPYAARGWSGSAQVPDRGGARAFEPALTAGAEGGALLTWRSFKPGAPSQVGAALHEDGGRFVRLPTPPATDADLFQVGGLLGGEGRPVLFFDDGEVQQGCAGVAITEMRR